MIDEAPAVVVDACPSGPPSTAGPSGAAPSRVGLPVLESLLASSPSPLEALVMAADPPNLVAHAHFDAVVPGYRASSTTGGHALAVRTPCHSRRQRSMPYAVARVPAAVPTSAYPSIVWGGIRGRFVPFVDLPVKDWVSRLPLSQTPTLGPVSDSTRHILHTPVPNTI